MGSFRRAYLSAKLWMLSDALRDLARELTTECIEINRSYDVVDAIRVAHERVHAAGRALDTGEPVPKAGMGFAPFRCAQCGGPLGASGCPNVACLGLPYRKESGE